MIPNRILAKYEIDHLKHDPTGGASLAAARQLFAHGAVDTDDTVVCTVTGHGFKDFGAWAPTDRDPTLQPPVTV